MIGVRDAVGLVRDGATVVIGGSGAGHALPQRFIDELAAVYAETGQPRDLTTVRVVGIGDFADRGLLPARAARAAAPDDRQQHRQRAAAGRARGGGRDGGLLVPAGRALAADARDRRRAARAWSRHVGLGTYVDPRQTGGKQNARTTEDLVEVVTLRGREWLLFHAFPIDVAVIRGTTADEDGNVTMEGEAVQGEMLAMAMAARNSGGIVIAQVRQLAPPRVACPCATSRCPAALVDHVDVDPDQWQTYITRDSPYYAGALRRPVAGRSAAPARRAQDHRPPLAARVPARGDLQPRLRDQPADRAGGLGGGDHRPAGAHGRAGHLRRGAGGRQRGRRRASTTRR